MAADFIITQGDSQPIFAQQIIDSNNQPVNMTGASGTLTLRSFTSPAAMTVTGTVTIFDPANGKIQWAPSTTDTAASGNLMGKWVITYANGQTQSYPTDGYLWIEIQPNVGSEPQQLISLPDLKMQMDVPTNDRNVDIKLIRLLEAARSTIENIVGPVIPTQFDEWHDGGQTYIMLRRRPSTALGTNPLIQLVACSEYNGPIEWPLAIVASPDQGQLYSCMLDQRLGRVVRRTAGGGVQAFPYMPQAVHVVYVAGQQSVPWNVYEATLEVVRSNYMTTQPVGTGGQTFADDEDRSAPLPFFMPRRAMELLGQMRRHPSIA